MLVRLPEGTPERIDALVGKNKRAEFIREAIEKELRVREGIERELREAAGDANAS